MHVFHLLTVQLPATLLLTSEAHVGDALIDLVDNSDTLPVVAVVPLSSPLDNATPALTEWGTAARVLRTAQPLTRSSIQPYLVSLHSLARMKLLHPHPQSSNSVPSFQVQYFQVDKVPNREIAARFEQVVLRPLDRPSRDASRKQLHQDRNHARRHIRRSYLLNARRFRWQHRY